MNLIGEVHASLVIHQEDELALEILNSFPNIHNKIRLTDKTVAELFIHGMDSAANRYLDSANQIISTLIDFGGGFQNFRKNHGYAVALSNAPGAFEMSNKVVRNLGDFWHNMALSLNTRATGYHSHYYEAFSGLPKFYSSEEKLNTINQIIYSMSYYKDDNLWKSYDHRKNYPITSFSYE